MPVMSRLTAVVKRRLPVGSRRRAIGRAGFQALRGVREVVVESTASLRSDWRAARLTTTYAQWGRSQLQAITSTPSGRLSEPSGAATFTVVVKSSDSPSPALRRTLQSVTSQSVDAAVVQVSSAALLSDLGNSVSTDFVIFLDEGSVLKPLALEVIAKQHRVDPSLEVIGFDSDILTANGRHVSPRFRPQFSPDILLGANYLGWAFAIAPRRLARAGAAGLNDRGIWQALLSADLSSRVVGRVPQVLLSEPVQKPAAASQEDADMVKAVLHEQGEATQTDVESGIVRVRFELDTVPTVSVIIPTRHSRSNLDVLLPSLAQTRYSNFDVTVVDNGSETLANRQWYSKFEEEIDVSVLWWTEEPFNYSRVNNAAVATTSGQIVVLLNDDTEIVDPNWLEEMVGMLMRDGVGTVGFRHLRADGTIQHGGVVLGPGGFADNMFSGMRPGEETLIGPTHWYRNALAVTGACVATKRRDWDEVGGLDERFVLMGSDVVLGLDQIILGRRNVVIPFDAVRHFESVTRGSAIPPQDFHASYWRYNPWLRNGDPYWSPSLSPLSAVPRLARVQDAPPIKLALEGLGRPFGSVAQSMSISDEATSLMHVASVPRSVVNGVVQDHLRNAAPFAIRTVNWFIPDIDMPFFGGLNTAFRLADKLARDHGVRNRFVILAQQNEAFFSTALAAAFPGLAGSEIHFYDGQDASIAGIPPADAAVATLWLTAMHVAKSPGVQRRFYLVQDYEPGFYPASTMFAMAEESYRLGLYGICNTRSMHSMYTQEYGGNATFFTPAIDPQIFNAVGRREKSPDEPITIFAYARDHFRNCWELVFAALAEVKRRHGATVRIIAAGARYLPANADFVDLGLIDYRQTGQIYRETDIGITMQISRHPSYLPLELMACGAAMVAPASGWFDWLFLDDDNAQLAMRTFDDVVEQIEALVTNAELRRRISESGLATIERSHSDWDASLDGIYAYMCDPEKGMSH